MNTILPRANLQMLVIAPHPDDAEIFCGGLVLSMTSRGYSVGVVDLSRAELSTLGTDEQRRRETEAASRVLGLSWRHNLELPNCWFHELWELGSSDASAVSAVEALAIVLRTVRPEIVLVPYMFDRHPDHVQSGKLAVRALFMSGLEKYRAGELPAFHPQQILFYQFRTEFTPSFVVDISPFIDRKYEAIGCYASQITTPPDTARSTLLSSANSMGALKARDAHLGGYIGVAFGEGYLSRSVVRIDDVLRHTRANPTFDALFFKELVS